MEKEQALFPQLPLNKIKDMIKDRWKARDLMLRPLVLVGHAGTGKTAIVNQAAEELGIQCRSWDLQFKEAPEILGLPYITDSKTLQYARPASFPTDGMGILFFDEFNRVNRDIRSAMLTLIQNREIESAKLGKDWIIVGAMNPEHDENYETQALDGALKDRVAFVLVAADYNQTLGYLKSKYGDDHSLLQWLAVSPKMIDFTAKSRLTPRGLDAACRLFLSISSSKKGIDLEKEFFGSIGSELGTEAAANFYKWHIKNNKSREFSIDDLFSWTPQKSKVIEIKVQNMINGGRNDIIYSVLDDIKIALSQTPETFVDKYACMGVSLFLKALSSDQRQGFVTAMTAKDLAPLCKADPDLIRIFEDDVAAIKEIKANEG